jgi:hypothetical protein
MNPFATYALGVGLLIGIAAGWLGVQRLWISASGHEGTGRDALSDRFSCGGDGGCGACEGPCERQRGEKSSRAAKENER